MKFFETSKYHSFKKSTYIALRWIGILGQLISVNFVYFFLNFKFDFIISNLIIFLGILSNLYLTFIYKKTQLSDRSAFIFLVIDILQLGILLYLTGGIVNPFIIFILIPSVFSSSNLSFRTNTLLVVLTALLIILLTFYSTDLPSPLSDHFHVSLYYYYSIPISLIIALVFLNYFAMTFGTQSRLRKEALAKMEEVMAKEHELLSLGGQAAAAAHSLGTPLSTITVIARELEKEIGNDPKYAKDVDLLLSQTKRCSDILKNLSKDQLQEDNFLSNIKIKELLGEIVRSYTEISEKKLFLVANKNELNPQIERTLEITYGLRNFIGNAVKYSNSSVDITLESNNKITEVKVCDDGPGFSDDILDVLGEPYIRSKNKIISSKSGLGLGTFIGKTLLERMKANVKFDKCPKTNGAMVTIKWQTKDLLDI